MGNLSYPPQTCFIGTERRPKVISFQIINNVFNKYVGNSNHLDIVSFNKCINVLLTGNQNVNFPRLAYTYLSERLYNLLSMNGSVDVTCERFTKGLLTLLSSAETKVIVLFNAISEVQNAQFISFNEILEFYIKILNSAFKNVFDYISYFLRDEFNKNNIYVPANHQELQKLVGIHSEDIKNYLIQCVSDIGLPNLQMKINLELFKKFAVKDNTIEINYGGKVFKYATSFSFMEDIGVNTKV